jgi:uncharacterized protein YbjT (DUF2867 family)
MADEGAGTVAVIGASGRSGSALCRALLATGQTPRPVVRNPAAWTATRIAATPRIADLNDLKALAAALQGAACVVSCAHARFAPAILAAAPEAARLVLVGSTRRFSRWPDAHGDGVRAGETAFLAAGRPGVMLHPTMIYGATGENNVQRLAALLRRLPVAPLPGGGRALVQPIHQDDVTHCLVSAVQHPWTRPETLVIAGPEPLPYREFLGLVAAAAGLRPTPILPVPAAPLRWLALLTRLLPGLPRIGADEIRRLTEDKAFDIGPMRTALGITPMPLADGLRLTFTGA